MTAPTLAEEYEARRLVWSDIQGHLPELYDTVCRYPQGRVVELGTRWGTSTAALLAAADVVDGHVWSVDPGPVQIPDWWAGTGRHTLVTGDDLAPASLLQLPDTFDVLFIDTSHTYAQTAAELRLYVPAVVDGGTILLHDTELARPEDAPPDGPPYPVALALNDFCKETGLSWVGRTGSSGLGVIDKPFPEILR